MSIQQFLISIVAIFILLAAYNCYRAKNQVYCFFTRRDKTVAHKWAKAKNGERIEFDGGWYYIVMRRIRLEALVSGFNLLFPTMVRRLEFTYRSIWPIDPETGDADAETPEARKNLDKREDIEAFNIGSQKSYGKVKGGLLGGGWLPIILVVGIVSCLYLVWQMQGSINSLGNAVNVLQEMMMKSGLLK